MNYLILGNGDMPKPELRAGVLQEIHDSDDKAEFNVLERDEPGWIEETLMGEAADYGISTYYYDDSVAIDKILLLNHDSNGEDVWDLIEALAPPAKVFVMNEQMVEIVPPPSNEEIAEEAPEEYARAGMPPQEAIDQFTKGASEGMTVVGDDEVLDEMSLPELKRTAEGLGVTPSDWRSKDAIRKAIREAPEPAPELKVGSAKAAELADKNDATEAQDDVVLYLMTAADYLMKAAAALGGND